MTATMQLLKKTLITIIDVIAVSMLPDVLRHLDERATFERGCLSLAALVHHPYDRIKAAVDRVAGEVSHPKRDLPSHIEMLMKNGWLASETNPEHIMATLGPTECEQGCLAKFHAALRKELEEDLD